MATATPDSKLLGAYGNVNVGYLERGESGGPEFRLWWPDGRQMFAITEHEVMALLERAGKEGRGMVPVETSGRYPLDPLFVCGESVAVKHPAPLHP